MFPLIHCKKYAQQNAPLITPIAKPGGAGAKKRQNTGNEQNQKNHYSKRRNRHLTPTLESVTMDYPVYPVINYQHKSMVEQWTVDTGMERAHTRSCDLLPGMLPISVQNAIASYQAIQNIMSAD